MKRYYFTFGNEGQLYQGGWVEIAAGSLVEAQDKFINHYGKEKAFKGQFLNYAFNYNEEQNEFEEERME